MAQERYVCRKCGWEWSAIPGEEEPPDCPECESDEIERLETGTFGWPLTKPEETGKRG